jgi:Tfp pilus assembly protein PilV
LSGKSGTYCLIIKLLMKSILLAIVLCSIAVAGKAQNAAKIIKTYLSGYEKKDWSMTSSQLADGFTFTSPAPDDHIPLAVYKQRCWPTSKFFKKIDFISIVQDGDHAFSLYSITTTDNKVIRNSEFYTFSNGKIKSIECFFGSRAGYPGNTK